MHDITLSLTPNELQVVIGALHTAAQRYRECAQEITKSDLSPTMKQRLVDQFNKQEKDCGDILAKIE